METFIIGSFISLILTCLYVLSTDWFVEEPPVVQNTYPHLKHYKTKTGVFLHCIQGGKQDTMIVQSVGQSPKEIA